MAPRDSMHILRAGTFRDVAGREVSMSEDDLAALAAGYRPREANVIVGHFPRLSDPSLAHIAALAHTPGRGVDAELEDVTAEARELTRSGRYTRCSAFLRRPSASEPWRLVHAGLLGAHAPAIPGLDEVRLAAPLGDGEQALFAEMPLDAGVDEAARGLAARFLDALTAAFARPTPAVTTTADDSSTDPSPTPEGAPVTTDAEAALAARQERLDAQAAQLARRLAAADALLARQREQEAQAWAQEQAQAGRVLPRHTAALATLVTALAAATGPGEGEGEDEQAIMLAAGEDDAEVSAADWLRGFVEELPQRIDYTELSRPDAAHPGVQLAAFAADRDGRRTLDERATALAAERKIPYADAVVAAAAELEEARL